MHEIIPYILAILVGIFTAAEAGINSQFGKIVNPKIATLHSLITGLLFHIRINPFYFIKYVSLLTIIIYLSFHKNIQLFNGGVNIDTFYEKLYN